MKKAATELLIVVFIASILGVAANAARSRGSLKWTKSYFAARSQSAVAATHAPRGSSAPAAATSTKTTQPVAAASEAQPDHGFQVISTDEVAEIVGPDGNEYDRGLNIFVDARNDEAYREGHIPGAFRCYHYELDICIDELVEVALSSDRIVVYCNGGTCEDSKFMCQELIDRDVQHDFVYLYEGGWKEWSERGDLPIVTGDE